MKLRGEIIEINENELTEQCLVRVNIYDDDFNRPDMNSTDKNIHLITQTSFWCNIDSINETLQRVVYDIWFNYVGSMNKKEIKNKSFSIDENTGEIDG